MIRCLAVLSVVMTLVIPAWPSRAGDAPAPSDTPAAADAPATSGGEQPAVPVPPTPPRLDDSEDYHKCLDMVGADPDGAYAFADAWYATGGGEPALHCQGLADIALGDETAGAGLIEKAVASSKAPAAARAAVLRQAIQAWLVADDPAHAYDDATTALGLAPDDPDLLVDRSIALATMERFMDAIDDLTRALALEPERADALVFRAAAWRNEGRLDAAKSDIDHAIAVAPDSPEALLERGIQRQRAGDAEGARADWQRVKDLAPDTATADLAEQNLALLEAGPADRD